MEPCERCSCTGTEVAAGEQLPQPLPRVLDRSETPVRLREQLSACPQGPLSPSSSQNCWQLLIAPCLEFTFPIGRTVSDLSCRDGIWGGTSKAPRSSQGGRSCLLPLWMSLRCHRVPGGGWKEGAGGCVGSQGTKYAASPQPEHLSPQQVTPSEPHCCLQHFGRVSVGSRRLGAALPAPSPPKWCQVVLAQIYFPTVPQSRV